MTTTAPAHVPTIPTLLNSTLWHRRTTLRNAFLHAWTAFLWHRAIWRADRTPEHRAAYKAAEAEYWDAMRLTNHLDGYVWSQLIAQGVDVDQLPADRDDCPRCHTLIRENYGCDCTNIDLAVELG